MTIIKIILHFDREKYLVALYSLCFDSSSQFAESKQKAVLKKDHHLLLFCQRENIIFDKNVVEKIAEQPQKILT